MHNFQLINNKPNQIILFSAFSISILISSCCVQGKMDEARQIIKNAKDTLAIEASSVSSVNSQSDKKISDGKIDSTILFLISQRILKFQNAMAVTISKITPVENLLADVKEFRRKYKSVVLPALDSIKNSTAAFKQRVVLYEMIVDGLNIADYKLFDLAAFFGPGKFSVPDDKRELASTSFSPIVDSIIRFSNKYKNINRTGSLIILGFADGTGFSAGPLFELLAGKIGKSEPSKEELNQKLSELRAEELIKLLSDQFQKKQKEIQNFDILKVSYLQKGKGENLPLPTITNYQVNDERRRIVLCYWAVLPD